MEYSRRPFVTAVITAAIVLAAGCSSGSMDDMLGDPSAGNVRVMLTTGNTAALAAAVGSQTLPGDSDEGSDVPENPIVGVVIRVSDIQARSTTLQTFVNVEAELPVDVDLLAVGANGGSFELAVGSLPPDTYDQLSVVISALVLTAEDGTRVTIEPPGEGWTVTLPTEPFTVVEGAVTTIQLQFQPASFRFDLDADLGELGERDFDPQFKIVIGE